MLSHPDPQVQYIISTLESQRDNLMIENGALAARLKEMEAAVGQPEPPKDVVPDELPAN